MNFIQFQTARLKRIRRMDSAAIFRKLGEKISRYGSYRSNIRRLGYALERHSLRFFQDDYRERPEGGPTNLETKINRAANGGPFEPYSISLINRAALQLVGDAKNILEAGCGTGMFASVLAAQNPHVQITASEFDEKTLAWTRANRPAANITYCRMGFEECGVDQFDLVVALEVIEHIGDYAAFLAGLARVAPRAIISTPNKSRTAFDSVANTPAYDEHVREWTAGELFWVLRCYYDDVQLYTLKDFQRQIARYRNDSSFMPTVSKCSVLEKEEPLIAVCSSPRRKQS